MSNSSFVITIIGFDNLYHRLVSEGKQGNAMLKEKCQIK